MRISITESRPSISRASFSSQPDDELSIPISKASISSRTSISSQPDDELSKPIAKARASFSPAAIKEEPLWAEKRRSSIALPAGARTSISSQPDDELSKPIAKARASFSPAAIKEEPLSAEKRRSSIALPARGPAPTPAPIDKRRSSIAVPTAAAAAKESSRDKDDEEPYQLRQLHKNWNTKDLPKGSVMDRIKVFSGERNRKASEEPELTNTGRTNPALRKRREMERQMELQRLKESEERRRKAASKYGFGNSKKAKILAATDIQSIARMYFAKGVAAKKREAAANRAKRAKEHEAASKLQALMRANVAKREYAKIRAKVEERRAKENRYAATQAEKERYNKAATKIQAGMRSALTRMRVLRMVEEMIEGLQRQESAEEKRIREVIEEAAALEAARRKQLEAEEERLRLASLASAQREANAATEEAAALEAARRKQEEAEEERLRLASLSSAQREANAEELARQKQQAEEALEAQRRAKEEEEQARKEAMEAERERRRKNMNLFVGPLPWGVGLLPDWWMDEVPHKTLFLDSISEEDDGVGFKEWRTGNLSASSCIIHCRRCQGKTTTPFGQDYTCDTQEVGDIFGSGSGPAHAMLRSPTVLIVSVGLWGMNIFFFQLFGINYRYVLQYDLMKEEQRDLQQQKQQELQQQQQQQQSAASTSETSAVPPAPPSTNSIRSKDSLDKGSIDDGGGGDGKDMDTSLEYATLLPEVGAGSSTSTYSSGAVITWYKLVIFSMILLVLLHYSTHLWMDVIGRGVVGAVLCFYVTVVIYIFIPLRSNQWLRRAFWITLQRTGALLVPRCWYCRSGTPRAIPFVDVFFADAMCSMSKVFFDWGMLLLMASHYPNPVPQAAHNIIIPSAFAAIPFLIRARQCLLMWSIGRLKKDPKRYQHVANAIKYSTSIWPLLVSAYQKTLEDPAAAKHWDGYLYFLQTVNALYALYWDIVMDWGMMQNPTAVVSQACIATSNTSASAATTNTSSSVKFADGTIDKESSDHHLMYPHAKRMQCHHLVLRPRLRFGLTMSALIVLADVVLRFSWLLRFVSWQHLFVSHDAFVLCTQFLEVFRRSIWNLLRVEWENIKQKQLKQFKARESLSDTEDDDDNGELMTMLLQQQQLQPTAAHLKSSSTGGGQLNSGIIQLA